MSAKRQDPLAGFDLGPVLKWLAEHYMRIRRELFWLSSKIGAKVPVPISHAERIALTRQEIGNVFLRFPQSFLNRSTLAKIIGKPTTWFAKDTTPEKPMVTRNRKKALKTTAFVPGFNTPLIWTESKKTQAVELYELDGTIPQIAKFMLVHTLLHEYTHTVINPLWFSFGRPYYLATKEGTMDGRAFLRKFAEEAAKVPPISHYAAAYRPLPTDPDDGQFIRRVGEELCESVAALILGYIYCDDRERCFAPFMDRPEVLELTRYFLDAERAPC